VVNFHHLVTIAHCTMIVPDPYARRFSDLLPADGRALDNLTRKPDRFSKFPSVKPRVFAAQPEEKKQPLEDKELAHIKTSMHIHNIFHISVTTRVLSLETSDFLQLKKPETSIVICKFSSFFKLQLIQIRVFFPILFIFRSWAYTAMDLRQSS